MVWCFNIPGKGSKLDSELLRNLWEIWYGLSKRILNVNFHGKKMIFFNNIITCKQHLHLIEIEIQKFK